MVVRGVGARWGEWTIAHQLFCLLFIEKAHLLLLLLPVRMPFSVAHPLWNSLLVLDSLITIKDVFQCLNNNLKVEYLSFLWMNNKLYGNTC